MCDIELNDKKAEGMSLNPESINMNSVGIELCIELTNCSFLLV